MTTSTDGHYVYYHINDISMGQGKEFKINKNSADTWDQNHYEIVNNYNGTDLKITASDNRSISAAGYVILYLPNTLVNPSNKAILCASTKLTDGIEQVFLKHPWNGGSWEYCNALTKNSSGKLVITKKYGNAGCNWSMKKEDWYDKWVATPTLVNEPQTGDECEFAFNPADQTITITKQLTKNLGSVTVTMTCNQQPNIYYFGGVDGSVTYPEWPGVNMTDNGDGTYSYKVDNVNLDLGLDYVITLKEVNENEWKSEDLNAKADVSHDVSIFNFPKIVVLGIDGKWDETNALTDVSNDYLTVSKTITLAADGTHNLKCHVGDAQYQGGSVVNITRANPSSNKFDADHGGDGKFTTDIAGNYIFTWTYKTKTLTVTYPELPTPEYKDITIQVYAKQVPNIWWWNGGDQCPSTEDIVNPSTGNKYQWNEAPAMEKVAGEDNWYTKTFAQVDITKGGIKFKLQSTDHSTSTTNEVVTTEDKCYDARVIATVTETTCGELPSGEVPTVTYNVTVPTGTPACYIAGAMNGWSHQAMTKVDETHYTITIEGAQKTQEYKYSASNNWDCVELNEDGSEKSNRTWTENDVVAKWATPPTYTIVGATAITGENWNLASTNNIMIKDGEAYTLTKTDLQLEVGDYEYKVVKNGAWGDGEYPNGTNEKVTIAENGIYTIVYTYTVGTSLTAVATKTGEYTPVQTVYTVAGDAALCGSDWKADDDANDMTDNGDGTFTWVKTDVKLTSNVGFKVVKNHDFGNGEYPAENWNINLVDYEGAAVYTVTITFTESSKEIAVTLTKTGEATPPVITYVLMGVNGDWDNGIALTQNPGNEDEYVLENQVIIKATDAVKVVTLTDGTATAWCGNVDTWSNATYTGGGNDNIVLEDGIYTFYFKKTANNIYINQTGYARNVTNTWGTICLPNASSSFTGATFYEVSSLDPTEGLWLDQLADGAQLVAGKPYVFEATASTIKVTYTGAAKSAPVPGAKGLTGTFTGIAADSVLVGNYIIAQNAVWVANASNDLPANRAYIDASLVPKEAQAVIPGRRRVCMGENATTGLDQIAAPAGQAVKVIENGQLIIIRDGVKYNVQGQVIR